MQISHSTLRDLRIGIALSEDDSFDVVLQKGYSSPENGSNIAVSSLIANVDLISGEASVLARGYLRNSNGRVGERWREMYLEAIDIPVLAKGIIIEEVRKVRGRIAVVKGVDF